MESLDAIVTDKDLDYVRRAHHITKHLQIVIRLFLSKMMISSFSDHWAIDWWYKSNSHNIFMIDSEVIISLFSKK